MAVERTVFDSGKSARKDSAITRSAIDSFSDGRGSTARPALTPNPPLVRAVSRPACTANMRSNTCSNTCQPKLCHAGDPMRPAVFQPRQPFLNTHRHRVLLVLPVPVHRERHVEVRLLQGTVGWKDSERAVKGQ